MLPPVSTRATVLPASATFLLTSAARGTAPAPSTTVFSISSRRRMALAISSSLTLTTSSIQRCASGEGMLAHAPHRDAVRDGGRRPPP